jgi:hypothetical protein
MVLTTSSDSNSDASDNEYVIQRRRRVFRKRIHLNLDVTDFSFNERFRVGKTTVEYLLLRIGHYLEHDT